MATVKYYKPLL